MNKLIKFIALIMVIFSSNLQAEIVFFSKEKGKGLPDYKNHSLFSTGDPMHLATLYKAVSEAMPFGSDTSSL